MSKRVALQNSPFIVQALEMYFDRIGKTGRDRIKSLPEDLSGAIKTDVPLDIALSLLKPDELEKLKNYVTSYLVKHNGNEA